MQKDTLKFLRIMENCVRFDLECVNYGEWFYFEYRFDANIFEINICVIK